MTSGEPLRLTREQVRSIDKLATERYHIPGIVLMENAARAVTDAAMEMLRDAESPDVVIVCGGGNNGGDGMAVARHLHNRGVAVTVALAVDPQSYRGDAAVNWHIVQAMKGIVTVRDPDGDVPLYMGSAALTIDALFGTGLSSPPRDPFFIELLNNIPQQVLSIDLPSGMDCDTGEPMGACVRAKRTVTFVAEKAGFANPASKQYTGDVVVGDIGCPRELIEEVGRSAR